MYLSKGTQVMREVLVIDDDNMCLQSLQLIISNLGYKAELMESGREGLKYVEQNYNNIDLIMLDMMMPGMSGLAVLECLKNNKNYKNIPVLIQSGLSKDDEDIKKAKTLGADMITKPYSKKIIEEAIKKFCNKP